MKADCPKCLSTNARYEKSRTDLEVVCTCGYRKVVFTTLLDIQIEHNSRPQDVNLPRPNTHLRHTLVCLHYMAPADSKEIRDTLWFQGYEFTVSDVSSYLTVLRSKGLVEVIDYRRGVLGGSTWKLTEAALSLMGVR